MGNRETALKNLERAEAARRSHGFYKFLDVSVSEWPEAMRDAYTERYSQLMSLPHIDEQLDAGIVAQVCRFEILLARVWKYLGTHDLINKAGQHQRVLNVLGVYENGLSRLYDKLGLTPESRKRLRIGKRSNDLADILSAGAEVESDDE